MSVADLPTLAEVQAERAGRPNWKPTTTRAEEKQTSDRADAVKLARWADQVRYRDRERCRVCGVKTVRTIALDPKRGEAHHIVSRTNPVTRYDVRNGLHVCLRHHQQLTRHRLFVSGTSDQRFTAGKGITAKRYLDANQALVFTSDRPEAAG